MLKDLKFTVMPTIKSLKLLSPWQNSNKEYNYALINQNDDPNLVIDEGDFDGIIPIPVKKIVVTSTTHIPALELLGVENTLIGFPETDYISSEKTRQRIDNGLVRELGKNEGINTEVLLEIKPDVVIGFGVDGVNKALENIQKANIPVIYNGDWVESSPLAKAEWIKFFGILYNKKKPQILFLSQLNLIIYQLSHWLQKPVVSQLFYVEPCIKIFGICRMVKVQKLNF